MQAGTRPSSTQESMVLVLQVALNCVTCTVHVYVVYTY